jgi:hypothetical protein
VAATTPVPSIVLDLAVAAVPRLRLRAPNRESSSVSVSRDAAVDRSSVLSDWSCCRGRHFQLDFATVDGC